jgi:hypothetical protein
VARAAASARNQGDPDGSCRTNYESPAGKGVPRQEECPDARPGVGFVHSSPWPDAGLEAGEGTNRLTKRAQATRCRTNDGSTLANLPAGDTQRVSLRSPVRANRTPGSVRGAPGNRSPYLDKGVHPGEAREVRGAWVGRSGGGVSTFPQILWKRSLPKLMESL